MASDILVPTLGESITEATVARWLKQPGEAVKQDEALLELETDKVTLEVNAPSAGVLSEVAAAEGATVGVGALLGRIDSAGTPAKAPAAKAPAASAPAKKAEQPAKEATSTPIQTGPEPIKTQPAETPKAAPQPAAPQPAAGSGESLEIKVPALGESVSEATVARWIRQAGEAVKMDEPIAELETDKVTLEVNAPAAGVLAEIKAQAGTTVEVGALLAVLAVGAAAAPAATKAEAPKAEAPKPAASQPAAPQPVAATEAASGEPDPRSVHRTAPGGRISAADLAAFLEGPGVGPLSPAVQRLVIEKGLDPARIPASGKDGRLTKEDVLKVVENPALLRPLPQPAAAPATQAQPAAPAPAAAPREERVRMTKLRQTVARRLKEAQNTAAMLTTFNEVDMSEVMALRSRHKDAFEKKHGVKLGFTSFFAKAVVAALREVPAVNARIDGDDIVYAKHYDLGMAVSTPSGLMVPVIRDCDAKSFAEIEQSLGELALRARDGKLKIEEMQGGTFTITNGGVFGSLLSTPILNPPQSGILGLHKIEERPIALKGQVVIRPMMYVALSYDHRLIDGREAVTFLVKVKEAIEAPETLLIGV